MANLTEEVLHVMTPSEWGKPIGVDEKWIQFVDENVKAKLPSSTKIESIRPHGASYWTRTAEISTQMADGKPRSYFLKVSQGDNGKGMVLGEFASMTALHQTLPKFVPEPIGTGTYASAPEIHFFCCELINMTAFTSTLAQLHSKGISPNGRYGFHVPTYKGTIPQYTAWHDTWEESYYHSIKCFMHAEEQSQGVDGEMQELCRGILDTVIPRLLRPLETGGRRIQPRLIHGDLWAGKASWNIDTDMPVVYDAAALYAHNEMEMAAWRPIRHLIGRQYMKAYFQYFPVSAPEEDQDARNMLYYLRWDLKSSALFSGNLRYRNMAKETMKVLIAMFPGGYDEWAKENGEEPVHQVMPPTIGLDLFSTSFDLSVQSI
ncbi:Fructosamine-3-kinase [Lachnellula occidentalis]|uniref:protein-ribulosamine 3-kinase n=1 Tax=Lachnellula occidentalis TaxID=215460 RepID=A0A8H8S5J1_9HELO|nr:Fructosamine-3-kinase [Lachnellula occidentalis]